MNKNKLKPFLTGLTTIIISLIIVFIQQSGKQTTIYNQKVINTVENTLPTDTQKNFKEIINVIKDSSTSDIKTTSSSTNNNTIKTKPTMMAAMHEGEYALLQVASHNSRSNCWTTINGGVYNITSWINQHPGGAEAIISLCGIDGSDAYNGQHGGERRPANELASFKIGILVK